MLASTPVVGYIVKAFPRATETFIAHEIRLLEAMGLAIRVYSIKPGETVLKHDVLNEIQADIVALPLTSSLSDTPLRHWLTVHWPSFRAAHRALFARHPARYLGTLGRALWMCWRYRKSRSWWPRKVFVKEFLQAGVIAEHILRETRVRHLHGHFCHGATTVTWLVSQLTRLEFSFTAHAKDIYEQHLNPRDLLVRKINAARFIATCTETNRRHLADLTAEHAHVHTIYHGLDPQFFAPTQPTADSTRPLILAVGRIVEKKGFRYLAEACALLKQQGLSFTCEIIGEPGEAYAELQETLVRLALDSAWFRLVPPMTQQALRARYHQAAVFVLPCLITDSGDRDGIPNVLAEAMASGVPVISTAISGIPELIRDRIDGYLVPDRDAPALAQALTELLHDRVLRAHLATAARARICDIFDSNKTTRALHHLLIDAMQRPVSELP
jgi:glycosyltransferase involved in cell wall biosynthesis